MQNNLHLKGVQCQQPKAFVNTTKSCNNLTMILPTLLKEAREAAGLTQEELAQRVGMRQQSLQKIEAGIIKNPRKLDRLESVLGLPPGTLSGSKQNKTLPQPMMARCPILSWQHAIDWPKNKEQVLVPEIERLASKLILGANSYALKLKDDSMINYLKAEGFREGGFVIVDPDRECKEGNYVVAKIEGHNELVFRKYINDAGRLILAPLNLMRFDKMIVTKRVTICGVVVGYMDILI